METRRQWLAIAALGLSLAALALALVAAVLSAADSGTSFGPQFLVAERVWITAAAVGLLAVVSGVSSIISKRGTRLGVVAVAIFLLGGPAAIVTMLSLPAA